MTIADVLAALLGLVLVGFGFPALFTLLTFFAPNLVERAADRFKTRPGSSFALGLALFIGFAFMLVIAKALPIGGKISVVLMVVGALSLVMVGGAGLATFVSEKYAAQTATRPSFNTFFRAAFLVELAMLLPIIGWFGILPVTVLTMFGAGVSAAFGSNRPQEVAPFSAQPSGLPIL